MAQMALGLHHPPSDTHTLVGAQCKSHRTWQTRARSGGIGGPSSWPFIPRSFSSSHCLLQAQQLFFWILCTQHTALGLFMGHQCLMGALEGAAALPTEEHAAICNCSPRAVAPQTSRPVDSSLCPTWGPCSYFSHSSSGCLTHSVLQEVSSSLIFSSKALGKPSE